MDLYDVLYIAKDATQAEIEIAYRRRMAQLDRTGVAGVIIKKLNFSENINYAYKILSNPSTRQDYNKFPGKYRGVCDRYFGF